jgi:dihydrofolate reductase
MVASLDGFIAKKDGSISWLYSSDHYEKGVIEENVEEVLKTIDCYVMGSRAYEHAVELSRTHGWAYGSTPTIVLTHRKLPAVNDTIEFFQGDLNELVEDRVRRGDRSIWVVGGAAVVSDFIRLKLAHEIRISIVPILISEGTPFFDQIGREQPLHVKDVTAYKNGMVELWYEIKT